MKKTLSTLLICALTITACGLEEPPIAAVETPCPTPRGDFILDGAVTSVFWAAVCPQPEVGGSHAASVPLHLDSAGDVVSGYAGAACTTTYSRNGCTLEATCVMNYADGTITETHAYEVSIDGLKLRGAYQVSGTGVYCPRLAIEGVAQHAP